MIDKMIVTFVAGVLVVVLVMQLLLCGLPLFRRLEFDAVCFKYTLLMDRTGGLDSMQTAGLYNDLNSRGFAVSQLTGTKNAPFGSNLGLNITASFPFYRMKSDLTMEEVSVSLAYQSNTVCRVLKSYGAAP